MYKGLKRTCTPIVLLIKPLFCGVLVAVAVVVCLSSLSADSQQLRISAHRASRLNLM